MLRQITGTIQKWTQKLCPSNKNEDDYTVRERAILTGYANFYVMIWMAIQMCAYLGLLSAFLFSETNYFMIQKDCCDAVDIITTDLGLPYATCSQPSCVLYDFIWSSGTWDWFDDRPRQPKDGPSSKLFSYDGEKYCCNLSKESDQCCDYIPWRTSCGAVMWGSCLAAMCGMLMTQVLLSGLYSLSSRRSTLWMIGVVVIGPFIRVSLFFITFYVFYGFLFIFLFFWLGMMWCDNPYAWSWWKYGGWYFYYFVDNMGWVLQKGVTAWDGHMDMDTMVGTHIIIATIIDLSFALIYIGLNKAVVNEKGKKLFDITWFDL